MLTGILAALATKSMLEGFIVTLAGAAVTGGAAGIWRLSMQVGELVAHMAALRSEVKQDVISLSQAWENHRERVELHIETQRELTSAHRESVEKDIDYIKQAVQGQEERIRGLESLRQSEG